MVMRRNYLLVMLVGLLALATAQTTFAQSDQQMVIHTKDGKIHRYPVSEIDSFKFVVQEFTTLTFTQAEVQADRSTEPGHYFISFSNDAWSETMTLDFYADPASDKLPSGTYAVNESKEANSICGSCSQLTVTDLSGGASETVALTGGRVVVVAGENDQYTMTMDLQGDNGKSYLSELTTTLQWSELLISTFTAVSASAQLTGDTNTMVSLVSAEGMTLRLDFYHKAQKWLPEGDYTFSTECTEGTISNYSALIGPDYSMIRAKAGSAKVSIAEKQYTIMAELELESGARYQVSYTGKVEGILIGGQKDEEYEFDTDAARVLTPDDLKPGECMIKFNDTNWHQEMTIDFHGQAEDKTLQPGTYTYSEEQAPMTISPKSTISFYAPKNKDVRFAEGSKVQVSIDEGGYTIHFDLIGKDDQIHYISQFRGTIDFTNN